MADPTARPRVLIPITIAFAVRYAVRTGLAEGLRASCDPVLALSWDDPALVAKLQGQGFEVVRLPDSTVGRDLTVGRAALTVHFQRHLRSSSTLIDRDRRWAHLAPRARTRGLARWHLDRLRALRPGAERRLEAEVDRLVDTDTNVSEHLAFLTEQRIDAVFSLTPFVIQELVLLLAVRRAGLPAITSILSFDNITTRPPLPIVFDRYLVWNRFNRDEILRSYPTVSADQVAVVGPAQFDFYADPSIVGPEGAWRERLGLAPGAPTVLFGAGVTSVAPHEVQHVEQLCAAIDRGDLPAELRVVVRRHPLDRTGRWDGVMGHPAVVFDDPGRINDGDGRPGDVDLDRAQIVGLCTSLAHSDVHVSVSSTMTLDGAFYDKPQVGPAFDASPGHPFDRHAQDLYAREHFVPIVDSGGIDLVLSPEALVAAVRRHLADPALQRSARQQMLHDLCTFTDGRCTARVVDEVAGFVAGLAPSEPSGTGPD